MMFSLERVWLALGFICCSAYDYNLTQSLERRGIILHQNPSILARNRHSSFEAITRPVTGEGDCHFPIDAVILQDTTANFSKGVATLAYYELMEFARFLNDQHPGSRVGMMTFRDKPLEPYGDVGDYCFAQATPFFPADPISLSHVANSLLAGGGADFAENQFGALIAACQSPDLGWRDRAGTANVIILITDSWPHYDEDGMNLRNKAKFSGKIDWNDPEKQCTEEYYPSIDQVFSVLAARSAYVGFVVAGELMENADAYNSWQWFNGFIGQPPPFAYKIPHNLMGFSAQAQGLVHAIEYHVCGGDTSRPRPSFASP